MVEIIRHGRFMTLGWHVLLTKSSPVSSPRPPRATETASKWGLWWDPKPRRPGHPEIVEINGGFVHCRCLKPEGFSKSKATKLCVWEDVFLQMNATPRIMANHGKPSPFPAKPHGDGVAWSGMVLWKRLGCIEFCFTAVSAPCAVTPRASEYPHPSSS